MKIKLDNSALAEFSCLRRAQMRIFYGISGYESPEMRFGSAAHRVAECLTKGMANPDNEGPELQQLPKDEEYEWPSILARDAFQRYSVDPLKQAKFKVLCEMLVAAREDRIPRPITPEHVEYKFAIESDDVIFCGTMDNISEEDGYIIITDYKFTTSKYPGDYLRDYRLKTQLPFYLYMLHQYPWLLPEQHRGKPIAARIRGVFYELSPIEIRDSDMVYYTPQIADEIHLLVRIALDQARYIRNLTDNLALAPKWGMATGACYRCPYATTCAQHDYAKELLMINEAKKAPYDPLRFRA